MPIHEYVCNRCAETTERIFLSNKDIPVKIACPNEFCGGVASKILSKGSFAIMDEFGDSVSLQKR